MSDMERGERPTSDRDAPWSLDVGPEPEWADAIRQARRERGDQLRELLSTPGDDDADRDVADRDVADRRGSP